MPMKLAYLKRSFTIIESIDYGFTLANDFIEAFKKYGEITELTRPMLLEWVDEILVSEHERIQVNLKFQDSYEQLVEYVNQNTKADIPA